MDVRHEAPWVTCRQRVPYGHTDQMGHVYYGNSLLYFEIGRNEWMRYAGLTYRKFEEMGFFVPVVEAHVKYRDRVFYDDLIEISAAASLVGRTRFKFHYQIRRIDEEKVLLEGYSVHGIVGENGRPKRIPPIMHELLDRLGEYDSEKD